MDPKTTPPNAFDDQVLDQALRPKNFDEYVGQTKIKDNLRILLGAAKKRRETMEHLLLHGPSGLGKTTLAYLIAKEFGSNLKITSGTALEKAGDVGSILTGLGDGDILFIDEVHRLNKAVEEVIYPAMENFKLDIIIGKGSSAKTLQIDLPRFTLIAATTRISMLSSPFRSRFGVNFRLDFYNQEDIEKIIKRSAKLLGINLEAGAITAIAKASRFTPRIANRLLKRVRDYAQMNPVRSSLVPLKIRPATGMSAVAKGDLSLTGLAEVLRTRALGASETSNGMNDLVTVETAQKTLEMLEIDDRGLEETDRKILRTIAETFDSGPVGLKAVAASISEEENTIADVYEPYLIQIGFLARTPKGRVITREGKKHLGINSGFDL